VLSRLRSIHRASQREQALIAARGVGYPGSVARGSDKLAAIRAAAAAFAENQVAYALIGGVAVGLRSGVPRATLDVDFAVATSVDRAWLIDHLSVRGFRHTGTFAHSVNLEHDSGEPVQIAFDPGFDPMIARAESIALDDLELRVVTTDDLIAMKRRAAADPGRRRSKALRDLADVALLEGDVPAPDEGW
jgi:predicted nucleotidyltransferase